ncbi:MULTISPECIES: carbohydrate porin [unclassified Sinorhizobium]|uniref:carbohydrate porin n=1 Tax=unclassified Sinorhizobium TaxID=2613772 RepID=UPI003523EE0D
MRQATLSAVITLLAGILATSVAHAAERGAKTVDQTTTSAAPPAWLLGDWNGERTRLQEMGIDFQFGYTSEIASNPAGGIDHKTRYTDQYTAGVTFDLDRLLDVPAAQFQVTLTQRLGRNLSEDAELGTLQQVQEVFGRGQTIRLTEFWFDQKYADGLIDWKIGRMPFGGDFASFACDFQNLTFCGANPGNLVGDYIFNWPISQWATRVKVALGGFGYVQAGVYDANPKYLGVDDQVLPVFFSGSTGALIPVELAWLPKFGDEELPGSYKIGGWYDTSTADDVVSDVNGDLFALTGLPPLRHRGRYGAYINFQQQVTSNLSLFLNAVVADNRTANTDRQIAAGFIYTGPFSARPNDDIGFAVGTTHVNDRVADAQASQGRPRPDSEYAFELYYTYRPTPGLLFRPNIQYVLDPGGISENKDVVVLGLKTTATF